MRLINQAHFRPICSCYPKGEEVTKPAVVLDPFAGSGTTGAVAKSLGRDYIGIEINPAYEKLISERPRDITSPLIPEYL